MVHDKNPYCCLVNMHNNPFQLMLINLHSQVVVYIWCIGSPSRLVLWFKEIQACSLNRKVTYEPDLWTKIYGTYSFAHSSPTFKGKLSQSENYLSSQSPIDQEPQFNSGNFMALFNHQPLGTPCDVVGSLLGQGVNASQNAVSPPSKDMLETKLSWMLSGQ